MSGQTWSRSMTLVEFGVRKLAPGGTLGYCPWVRTERVGLAGELPRRL